MKYFLTFLIAFLIGLPLTAHSAGIEYTTTSKPVRCTNPETNVDGSPVTDIVEATIYVSQTPGDKVNYDLKMAIPGGCADNITQDISTLTPGVQYHTYGEFVTAGGTADMSNAIPFMRTLPRPNPLLMLE